MQSFTHIANLKNSVSSCAMPLILDNWMVSASELLSGALYTFNFEGIYGSNGLA